MEIQTVYQTPPPDRHSVDSNDSNDNINNHNNHNHNHNSNNDNIDNVNNNNSNQGSNDQNANGDQAYFSEIKIDDGKWTRDQTQILIDTWKLHKDVLLNSASSLSEHFRVWKVIASEVNKLSPPKSLQQCKKKFRNIRYICKTAMNNNKQPGAKKHYPMFYTEFVKILSESQKLLFDDSKIKYDGRGGGGEGDVGGEYPGEPLPGDGHPGDGVLDYPDHGEPTMAKYYSSKVSSYCSPRGSPHESPTSCEMTSVVDVNGATVVSVIPLPADIKSEITYVPNGGDAGNNPAENCHNNSNNNNNNNNNNSNTSGSTDDENNTTPPRKHRHDISIMGYPAHKRPRLDSTTSHPGTASTPPGTHPHHAGHHQGVVHHKTMPAHKAPHGGDYYPTMASLPSSDPAHAGFTSGGSSHTSAFSKTPKYHQSHHDSSGGRYPSSRPTTASKKLTNGTSKHHNARNFNSGSPNGYKHLKSPSTHSAHVNGEVVQDRFLDLQERQMELFNEMLQRHEQFLMRLLQQQREAAEEAQQRDRNFMFKLVEVFLKDKKV